MKCPKCGSELQYNTDERVKIDWYCPNNIFGCHYHLSDEKYNELLKVSEQQKYQARLDRVLAKFEEVSAKLYQLQLEHTNVKYYDEKIVVNFNQLSNEFYFTTHVILNHNTQTERIVNVEYKISLDTVEHLIKDLEG